MSPSKCFRRRIDIVNFQNVLSEEAYTRKSYIYNIYILNYFHSNRLIIISPCIIYINDLRYSLPTTEHKNY